MVCFHGRSIVPRPNMSEYSWNCQVPRAPLHAQGVTSFVVVSSTTSTGVTLLSSLLWTPAPVLNPPPASVVPSDSGSVQVAVRPCWEEDFPDVALRILPCVLGPLPRRFVECISPFFPPRHRPPPREDRVGAPHHPYSDFPTAPFARLQSFTAVQARSFAHHPGRSSRYGHVRMAAVVSPSEPLVVRDLPTPRICLPSASGH